jgi:DNA-directed RNA polymerase beta' subunit
MRFTPEPSVIPANVLLSDPRAIYRDIPTAKGIFSMQIFGNMLSDTPSCACGKTLGNSFLGSSCKHCNTLVILSNQKLNTMGYVDLGEYRIIRPMYWFLLRSILGGKTLALYCNYINPRDLEQFEEDPKLMFSEVGKGIINFEAKFVEILNYHKQLYLTARNKKAKVPHIDRVIKIYQEKRNLLFTSAIPVVHSRLRPAVFVSCDLILDTLNSHYTSIISLADYLKSITKYEKQDDLVLPMVYKLQQISNELFDIIFERTTGKKGNIRTARIGKRIEFSARCVITPSEFEIIDRVEIPYALAVIMVEPFIIHYLMKVRHMTVFQAYSFIRTDFVYYSDDNYKVLINIIKILNKNQEPFLHLLINRNPTINLGSILKMEGWIKRNNELTMNISNQIHEFLNSDYDGDVLNLFAILIQSLMNKFDTLKPSNLLAITKSTNLNKDFGFGLSSLLSI